MTARDRRGDLPGARAACVGLAERLDGLTVHTDGSGALRSPYVSGTLRSAGGAPVEVRRSVLWDGDGLVVSVAGGPFGAWAKPLVPDPDHQEGGLTFMPDHREPPPGGVLAELPSAQAALHDLWASSRWPLGDGSTCDGLVVKIRPDGVVGHLHRPAVTAEALVTLVRFLPDVAMAAGAHDPDWRETVHPPRARILWPAAVVVAVAVVVLLAYFALR